MKKVFIKVLERYEESNKIKQAVVKYTEHRAFKVGEIVDDFQICVTKGVVQFYEELAQDW
jgi:hypothetical protein